MATDNELVAIAKAVAEVGKKLKQARHLAQQVLDRNVVESITWDASLDATLQAGGLDYTGPEVSNAIGTLDQFVNLWENQAVTQGDHGGNIEKLVEPIV